jgi:hypothetical protein
MVDPKPEAHLNNIKYSVRTAKKTQRVFFVKINWLTLFREIIATSSENHTKPTNKLRGQNTEILNVKAGSTYSYHWILKG